MTTDTDNTPETLRIQWVVDGWRLELFITATLIAVCWLSYHIIRPTYNYCHDAITAPFEQINERLDAIEEALAPTPQYFINEGEGWWIIKEAPDG